MSAEGRITIQDVEIIEVVDDPRVNLYTANIGSLALNSVNGSMYRKYGAGDYEWTNDFVISGARPFCRAALTADQTTNLSAGNMIPFNSFITNMSTATGLINLEPTKYYEVSWAISALFSASGGYLDTRLYVDSALTGMTLRSHSLATGTRESAVIGCFIVQGSTLQLQITANSSCTRVYANGTWLMVKVL